MKKILYFLPSIIFNVIEFLIIILIGLLLEIKFINIIFIILLFSILRMITGTAIHYKSWKLCLLWSTLQITSLFIVAKTDNIIITILYIIFSSLILSGKGDINDIFMWGGNNLNLEVFDWVKYNQDNIKLKDYENKLKELDKKKYYIFKYRFREFKTYKQIADLMDIDAQRVSDEIKIMSHFIEFSIRLDD